MLFANVFLTFITASKSYNRILAVRKGAEASLAQACYDGLTYGSQALDVGKCLCRYSLPRDI